MSPRTFSTFVLRLFAVWLLVEGLLNAVDVFLIHNQLMEGLSPKVRWGWYLSPTPSAPSASENMYLHDAYYVVAHSNPALIPTALRFASGLILWFGSKPIARFLTRDLESPGAERGNL